MENAQDSLSTTKEDQMQATEEDTQPLSNSSKKTKKNRRKKRGTVSSEPSSSSTAYSAQETLSANSLIKESREHDLEQQIKKQQNRIENLEKQVEERQNAIETFGPMCASLERDFNELKKGDEEAKKQIISLDKEKEVLLEELKTEKLYRSCTDEELVQKLKLAEEEIKKLEKEKTKLDSALSRHRLIINSNYHLAKMDEKMEEIWQETKDRIAKLEDLQSESSALSAQVGQLEREKVTHARIAEENRAMKEKLAELHEVTGPNSLLEKNMALKKQIESLNAELSETQRQYDTLKTQVAKSKDDRQALLKAQAENKKRLDDFTTLIYQFQTTGKDLQEKLTASESCLRETENRERILITQKQELEKQRTELKTTLLDQKQELENIKKQKEKLKKEKQALEKINTKETPLAAEQAETLAKLKEQEARIKAQEEELKKKTAENQSLNDRFIALHKEKNSLETRLKEETQTSKSLQARVTATEKAKAEENQQLKAENSSLKKQEEDSNKELESFKAGYILAQKDWQEAQEKNEVTIRVLKEHEQKLLANLKALEERPQEFKRPKEELIEANGKMPLLKKQEGAREKKLELSPINKGEREQNRKDLALEQPQALRDLQDEIKRKEGFIIKLKCIIKELRESNQSLIKELSNQGTELVKRANQALATSLMATSQCLAPVIQDNQNLRYNESHRCVAYDQLQTAQNYLIVDNYNLSVANHHLYQEGLAANHHLHQEGQLLIQAQQYQYLYSSSLGTQEMTQALMENSRSLESQLALSQTHATQVLQANDLVKEQSGELNEQQPATLLEDIANPQTGSKIVIT